MNWPNALHVFEAQQYPQNYHRFRTQVAAFRTMRCMIQPNPIAMFSRFPVSVIIALISIAVTLRYKMAAPSPAIEIFIGSAVPLEKQPWLLFTTIFPHGNLMHIFFNLSAWWYFARVTEAIWGPSKLLGVTILTAIISSAAEIALFRGGIGLSGVVYALVAMIYVVQQKDPRFAGVVTSKTAKLFAVWFVVCIFLTVFDIMAVGNVAHGVGALSGAMIGWAAVSEKSKRPMHIAAIVGLAVVSLVGATIARPYVNIESRFATPGK